ncbi:hypothetical protein FQA39_LY12465 [Lamprigera yunnana]|nr:hypothetical protein FQA39_LY12465 [Lamprigera yunnana]
MKMTTEVGSCSLFVCTFFILIIIANFVKTYHKIKGRISLLTLFVLFLLPFMTVLMMVIICIPILWVYKILLKAYLKIKHGSKFIGMVESGDATYVTTSKSDAIICYLLILEVGEGTSPHQVYETMKDVVNKNFLQNGNMYKLNSALHYFAGYFYMLKEEPTLEQCVKRLRVIENQGKISREKLMQLISECQYKPLSKNDSILWDCSVGVQPVEWGDSTKPNTEHYPILFRTHHFIGDAFAFIQFLFGVVADKSDNPEVCRKVYLSKVQGLWWPFKLLNNAVLVLYVLIFLPSLLLQDFILVEKVNVLRTVKPTNVDILATKVDDGEYLQKIKCIRSSFKEMNFSTVLFTALSLSLQEHLRKTSSQRPESLILTVLSLPKAIYLRELPVGHLTSDDIVLKNSVSAFNMNLPIFPKNNLSLEERLQFIQREANGLSESPSAKLSYVGIRLAFQVLPLPILKFVTQAVPLTLGLSMLPGTEKAHLNDGVFNVKDCIFLPPYLKKFNFTFSSLTYDKKLHIALKVDATVVGNRNEAQSILDDVFKYLHLLEKEISLKKCK